MGFRVRFVIETTMEADNLEFNNIRGNVTSDAINLSNFSMDLDIKGVTVCNMRIKDHEIPRMELEV